MNQCFIAVSVYTVRRWKIRFHNSNLCCTHSLQSVCCNAVSGVRSEGVLHRHGGLVQTIAPVLPSQGPGLWTVPARGVLAILRGHSWFCPTFPCAAWKPLVGVSSAHPRPWMWALTGMNLSHKTAPTNLDRKHFFGLTRKIFHL